MCDVKKIMENLLYERFHAGCLCINCEKSRKIKIKKGFIKKVISCSRYRNNPKSYISYCMDMEEV